MTPEAAAVASAPAVSTPAPSAPVAAPPAPAASPAETTPQAPPAAAPPSGDGTQQPPAAAAPQPGAEPKQEDFPGDVEAFLDAHNAWDRKQQGLEEEKPAEQPAPEAEAKPAEEAAKPAEQSDAVTPESLNSFLQEDAALKAAIDANPKAKGAIFEMARKYAVADPIAKRFAYSDEAAQFAEQASGTMVEIRSGFLEALDSGNVEGAFSRFAEEFAERDKDGNPVKDAQGNIVYGEDFQMMNDHIVDTYFAIEMGDLKQAIDAGQFPNEDAKEQAEMTLQALQWVLDWKAGKLTGAPDLSKITDPNARAYYEAKEKELAEREQKLNGVGKEQDSAQRKQQRQDFEVAVQRKVGGSVGRRLDQMIKEEADAGVFIPSYVLEAKDPKTGISLFAQKMLDRFAEATYGRVDQATGKVVGGVSFIRNQMKSLARRAPSPQAEQDRVDFAMKLIDAHLPAIFKDELRQIQRKAQSDSQRRGAGHEAAAQLTEREPRGGGAPTGPKPKSAQDAMQMAYKEVDEQFPDLMPAERLEKALRIKDRILGM